MGILDPPALTKAWIGRASGIAGLDANKNLTGLPANLLAAGGKGDNSTDNHAALAATDALGTTTIIPKGTYKVNSNITLSNPLHFAKGATLKPAGGVTVTLSGGFHAGLFQVFDTSLGGTVRFAAGPVDKILPHWWGAASGADSTTAIQAAINAAAWANTGEPFSRRLFLPDGSYVVTADLNVNTPLVIEGATPYGSRLLAEYNVTNGVLCFTNSGTPSGLLNEENHLSAWGIRNLGIDGNGRANTVHAIYTDMADRARIENVFVRWCKGSFIKANRSLRETLFTNCRSWMCGSTGAPVVDLYDHGSGAQDGHNLNRFINCQFALNLGPPTRHGAGDGIVGTVAPVVRNSTFVGCVFHGMPDIYDAYTDNLWGAGTPVTLGEEGGYNNAHIIQHARSITFIGCRHHATVRGQPCFTMKDDPTLTGLGISSINSCIVDASETIDTVTQYSSQTVVSATASNDELQMAAVTGSNHDLQTGSKVTVAGTSLPTGLAAGTYYVINVDRTNFKLASSRANALANTPVDITADYSGAFTLTQQDTCVGSASAGTDKLTIADHRLSEGARVQFAIDGAGVLPGGITAATDYRVHRVDKDTIQLATSSTTLDAGTYVDITDAGTAPFVLTPQTHIAVVKVGELHLAGGNIFNLVPSRAYVRIDATTGATAYVDEASHNFVSVPAYEYSNGAIHTTTFSSQLFVPNTYAYASLTTTAGQVQMAKVTPANVVLLGNGSNVSGVNTQVLGNAQIDLVVNNTIMGRYDTVGLKPNNAGPHILASATDPPSSGFGGNGDWCLTSVALYLKVAGAWVAKTA